jgi:hypothetical protein
MSLFRVVGGGVGGGEADVIDAWKCAQHHGDRAVRSANWNPMVRCVDLRRPEFGSVPQIRRSLMYSAVPAMAKAGFPVVIRSQPEWPRGDDDDDVRPVARH